MNIPKPLYVALCVVVPPLWGLLSYWLFDLAARRWPRRGAAPEAAGDEGDDCETGA